jgi:predicted O-methyltransferase YrrM
MARLLYGISAMTKPKNVLVIGSALSNALIWLAIPVLATADTIIGVDVDREDNEISLANLKRYGANTVQILTMNGLDAHRLFSTIDLLFIDIYSEKSGKAEYVDIIEKMYEVLAEGAIVLAHDICYPKFSGDLAPYLAIVRDKDKFQTTCTLAIDRYGLEVSIR